MEQLGYYGPTDKSREIYSDQPNPSTLSGKGELICHAQKRGVCGCRNHQGALGGTDSRCL